MQHTKLKASPISCFFPSSAFSSRDIFWMDMKSFFSDFRQLFLHVWVTEIGSPSLDTLAFYRGYVLKFHLCEHGIPCVLEINING